MTRLRRERAVYEEDLQQLAMLGKVLLAIGVALLGIALVWWLMP